MILMQQKLPIIDFWETKDFQLSYKAKIFTLLPTNFVYSPLSFQNKQKKIRLLLVIVAYFNMMGCIDPTSLQATSAMSVSLRLSFDR